MTRSDAFFLFSFHMRARKSDKAQNVSQSVTCHSYRLADTAYGDT